MKIILSREGFDSAAGGVASPILPDGTMLSLPIPDRASPIRYADVRLHGHDLGPLVDGLTRGKMKANYGAHLDPDVVPDALPRLPGWRPTFGQAGSEQSVLVREGVGPGDVFLFFGWFRDVVQDGAVLRYRRGAPDLHVIWGWMQAANVVDVATGAVPAWASYHPHVAAAAGRTNSTLYLGGDRLEIGGAALCLPGSGVFRSYHDRLRLTKAGATRSVRNLPGWFELKPGRRALGYHTEPSRWSRDGDRVDLQAVARGQEFVLDVRQYPEAIAWLRQLLVG
jgi:hypothetical protein